MIHIKDILSIENDHENDNSKIVRLIPGKLYNMHYPSWHDPTNQMNNHYGLPYPVMYLGLKWIYQPDNWAYYFFIDKDGKIRQIDNNKLNV